MGLVVGDIATLGTDALALLRKVPLDAFALSPAGLAEHERRDGVEEGGGDAVVGGLGDVAVAVVDDGAAAVADRSGVFVEGEVGAAAPDGEEDVVGIVLALQGDGCGAHFDVDGCGRFILGECQLEKGDCEQDGW